jgi:ketosteroid isomerase-like protein
MAVSENNLEIARRGWDALNRQDLDAVLAHIHPDVEWRPAQGPGGMEGNVYRGREAYERWLREELPEVWEEFRGEDLDFRELSGGRVLLLGYIRGRGRASGAEVRVPFGQAGAIPRRPGGADPRISRSRQCARRRRCDRLVTPRPGRTMPLGMRVTPG